MCSDTIILTGIFCGLLGIVAGLFAGIAITARTRPTDGPGDA